MNDSSPGAASTVNVRGFTVENALTDGLASSGSFAFQTPLIGVERIDVIKGPESVIGGTTSKFGGAVNLVSKRPQAQTARQLQYTLDSNGRRQLGLDLTGALNENKELVGRLILSADQHGETDLDVNGGHDYYIAPSLGWQDADNNLVVGFEAQNLRKAQGSYVYFLGTDISEDYIPAYRSKENAIEYKRRRSYFDYQRTLGNDWAFSLRGQYLEQATAGDYWLQQPLSVPADDSQIIVYGNSQQMNYRSHTIQADISKQLDLGFSRHRLLLGFDYLKSYNNLVMGSRSEDQTTLFYLFEPGTTGFLPSVEDLPYYTFGLSSESGFRERGIVIQDQITLWDKLHVKLALRRIKYDPEPSTLSLNSEPTIQPPLSKNMPSIGIAYQYIPTGTVYASYSEGVERPGNYFTSTGESLPPTEAESREVGVKHTFFDERLVLTTALFDIRKTNVPEADPLNPGFYQVVGGAHYRGLEIELNGRVTPALSISANYTNTLAETDSGDRSPGTSRHAGSLWTLYRFQDAWRGWNIGGGIVARSATYQDVSSLNFTTRNPGNARIDLTGGYEAPDWSVRLGIRNLANRTLFPTGSTIGYALLEPKRMMTLSGTYNF